MISHLAILSGSAGICKKATRRMPLAALCIVVIFPLLARSQGNLADEADAKEQAIAEFAWQAPSPPLPENLLHFYASPTTRQSFAVDSKSLTVDADAVVRYTMVATSSSGAKSISYEGIRCSSSERRLYAVGQSDGSWTRARIGDWLPISNRGANQQHAALAEYLCKQERVADNARSILDAIRYLRVRPEYP